MTKTAVHSKFLIALLLGWLCANQVLLLSHEATHGFHDQATLCDDYQLASSNSTAATHHGFIQWAHGFTTPRFTLKPLASSAPLLSAFHARAPPAFA